VKTTNYKGAQSAKYKQADVQKKHKVPSTNKQMFKRSTKCQAQTNRCSKEAQSAKHKQADVQKKHKVPSTNKQMFKRSTKCQAQTSSCSHNYLGILPSDAHNKCYYFLARDLTKRTARM
jgi:hypothetical protein